MPQSWRMKRSGRNMLQWRLTNDKPLKDVRLSMKELIPGSPPVMSSCTVKAECVMELLIHQLPIPRARNHASNKGQKQVKITGPHSCCCSFAWKRWPELDSRIICFLAEGFGGESRVCVCANLGERGLAECCLVRQCLGLCLTSQVRATMKLGLLSQASSGSSKGCLMGQRANFMSCPKRSFMVVASSNKFAQV